RNGKLIATGIESNAREKQRAERAEQSLARLKEKLREMGIDPEEI
ncbi:MAG: Uma2 family endonuclease, partial [Gammaproteobacteria bacterium]|nr:Uma2 family endonuclease [Gammaproteobacteria bacterium]